MQLEGSLDQFPLAELLAMVVGSSVTGVLELALDTTTGQIFSRDGRLYHAVAGELDGTDAICRMFAERAAQFRFVAGQTSDTETIQIDAWDLIEEGERQAKIWQQVQRYIRGVDWIPALRSGPPQPQVSISEGAWSLLPLIDGRRNIAAISREAGQVPIEVAMQLCELLVKGLITVSAPSAPGAPATPRASVFSDPTLDEPPPSSSPTRSNFFERLLTKAPLR
jgi:hypothetical protein